MSGEPGALQPRGSKWWTRLPTKVRGQSTSSMAADAAAPSRDKDRRCADRPRGRGPGIESQTPPVPSMRRTLALRASTRSLLMSVFGGVEHRITALARRPSAPGRTRRAVSVGLEHTHRWSRTAASSLVRGPGEDRPQLFRHLVGLGFVGSQRTVCGSAQDRRARRLQPRRADPLTAIGPDCRHGMTGRYSGSYSANFRQRGLRAVGQGQ